MNAGDRVEVRIGENMVATGVIEFATDREVAYLLLDDGSRLAAYWRDVRPEPLPADDPLHELFAGSANPKDALGVKKAALRFVPHALRILAVPAMALGANKYGPMNWRTAPVKLTVYLEAIDRHLAAFADGQDNDPESGASHLSHAAACLGIIADAEALGNLIDDRFEPGPAAVLLDRLDTTKGAQ